MSNIRLGRTVILVKDYDTAFTFYHQNFGCRKLFDQTTPDGQRLLHVGFGNDGFGIWFLKALGPEQEILVGKQTGGQPTLVLYTQDIRYLLNHLRDNEVQIIEDLVETPSSRFFHCLDLYGNRITVVELSE